MTVCTFRLDAQQLRDGGILGRGRGRR
jgi:hypothetical protein